MNFANAVLQTMFCSIQNDPNLQPVNIIETRDILPATPITAPPTVLPGNLSRYVPKENVFCSTMNAVPATSSMLNKLKLPLAIHIHPFKDMPNNVSTVCTYFYSF